MIDTIGSHAISFGEQRAEALAARTFVPHVEVLIQGPDRWP